MGKQGGRVETQKFLKIVTAVLAICLTGFFLNLAKTVLVPFFLAVLLSFALMPVLDFLVRKKIPKGVAVAGILVLTFLLLYLVGTLFYSSVKALVTELPSYNNMVTSLAERIAGAVHNEHLKTDLMTWLQRLNVEKFGPFILSALGPFLSFMSQFMLVFVFLIFILAGRGRLQNKIILASSPEQGAAVAAVVRRIDSQVARYLAVKSLAGLAGAILVTLVLAAFRLPFAIVFGILAFFLNYIPNLGAVVSTLLPVIMAVFFFGSLGPALWIWILLAALHIVIGNVVEPRLMGRRLGLSPLLVLFALLFWAWLWGIPGAIVAVPILAVVKIVFANVPSLKFLEALME
jgi:predicted PurR-regulated permease PerM